MHYISLNCGRTWELTSGLHSRGTGPALFVLAHERCLCKLSSLRLGRRLDEQYLGAMNQRYIDIEGLYVGKRRVVDSGSLILEWQDRVTIKFERWKLEVVFKNTDNDKNITSINGRLIDPTTLLIEAENFNNPLGSCTSEPLRIGQFAGRPLLLAMAVHAIGSEKPNRVLHYTIFSEEA